MSTNRAISLSIPAYKPAVSDGSKDKYIITDNARYNYEINDNSDNEVKKKKNATTDTINLLIKSIVGTFVIIPFLLTVLFFIMVIIIATRKNSFTQPFSSLDSYDTTIL
jgi:Fe2+ transport system protein B